MMGGTTARHEKNSTEALENCVEACQIFREVAWLEFFKLLRGLDESVALEFSQNLTRDQT